MITLLGATGNIGSRIAHNLIQRGEKFRVVVRSPEKLDAKIKAAAEVTTADASDTAKLTAAFKGSDAVFALIPPNFAVADFRKYQAEFGASLVKAIKDSGVKKVVFLSSIAADQPAKTGPIVGIHLQEELMKKELKGVDIVFLRPAYFMENLFANIALIKGQGMNGSIINPDLKMHLVATADIGDAATDQLTKRAFTGVSVIGIRGPAKISMKEVTQALGAAIGKPDLAYVAFPPAAAVQAMVQAGLTKDMAEQYAEMSIALNEKIMDEVDTPTVTGQISITEFAKTLFAPAFKGEQHV